MSTLIQTEFEQRVLQLEKVVVRANIQLPIMVSTWNLDPSNVNKILVKRAALMEYVQEHNRHNDSIYGQCDECRRVSEYHGHSAGREIEAFLNDHLALIAEMKLERERGSR